nr:hypothetical protein [Tanacetum cinerariifolium]
MSKESTLQVVYFVLILIPFYKAFLVTADVPEIYMQEFWATAIVHHHSIRFKMNNKKRIVNLVERLRRSLISTSTSYINYGDHVLQLSTSASVGKVQGTTVSGAAPPKTKASMRKMQSSSDTTISPLTAAGTRLSTSAKGSLQQTHISQASGSSVDEGTVIIPGVPDVPTEESDEEISWKSSDEDDDDDVDDQSEA